MDLKAIAKPREQILALMVVLGILVAFFRGIYLPARAEYTQLGSKIQNLKLEKEALEKFTQALLKQVPMKRESNLSPQLKILKGDMASYAEETSLLLAQFTTPQFLKGIDVKKMSDLPPVKKNGHYQSSFFINVQGPFQNILDFLGRVEQFPSLTTVNNITVKALDSKAAYVELDLDGTMYHLGEGR